MEPLADGFICLHKQIFHSQDPCREKLSPVIPDASGDLDTFIHSGPWSSCDRSSSVSGAALPCSPRLSPFPGVAHVRLRPSTLLLCARTALACSPSSIGQLPSLRAAIAQGPLGSRQGTAVQRHTASGERDTYLPLSPERLRPPRPAGPGWSQRHMGAGGMAGCRVWGAKLSPGFSPRAQRDGFTRPTAQFSGSPATAAASWAPPIRSPAHLSAPPLAPPLGSRKRFVAASNPLIGSPSQPGWTVPGPALRGCARG